MNRKEKSFKDLHRYENVQDQLEKLKKFVEDKFDLKSDWSPEDNPPKEMITLQNDVTLSLFVTTGTVLLQGSDNQNFKDVEDIIREYLDRIN